MLVPGSRSRVSFAFYTGLHGDEPLINRATQWWTGSKYIHCEIVFHTPTGNMSCGVWQGETTYFRRKTFGKSAWEWRSISLSREKAEKLYKWCRKQADDRIPFNKWGFIRCLSPIPRPSDGTCWFCSELCTAALQQVGLLCNEIPGSVSPSYFYSLVCGLNSFRDMSPLADERLSQKKATQRTALSFGRMMFPIDE